MNNSETITTSFGKNLSFLIGTLGMSKKAAAAEIDLSYNTLSNIINQNFPPAKESIEKIKVFITKKGFDISLLYKSEIIIRNFRIRIDSKLSGNEKSALRNTLTKIEHLLNLIASLEHDKGLYLHGYFDLYALPYADYADFYSCQRLDEFRKIVQEKKRDSKHWANYFLKPQNKDFWGNLYYGIFTGGTNAFRIKYLIESLGIRLHFMSFGTEKVKSCSTSIFKTDATVPNSIWAEPTIIINTDSCDCAEKCLIAMAEEFFHMISNTEEYSVLNTNEFLLEKTENRSSAEDFTKRLFLPEEVLKQYFDKKKNISAYDITYLKQQFNIPHGLLLQRLKELEICDITKDFYISALNSYYKDSQDKLLYQNSEPEPLPLSYRGSDFIDSAILAAYKKNLISESETANLLNCSETDLKIKLTLNSYEINVILENM
ncbi:MAG: hypothetical protein J6I53_05435 [Treponema sp.]|nr:hypothetical protein [Treponema sp.]